MENKLRQLIFQEYSKYFLDIDKDSKISVDEEGHIIVEDSDGHQETYIVITSTELDEAVNVYIDECAEELLSEITIILNRNGMERFTHLVRIDTDELSEDINQDDYANIFNCEVLDPDYYYNGKYYLIGKLNN